MGIAKHLTELSLNLMESLEAFLKADEDAFPDDSLHLQGYVQGAKDFLERNKNNVEMKDKEISAQIVNIEKEMESIRKLITFHEDQHAEL